MMKKIIPAALLMLGISACNPDPVLPETNKDSQVVFDNITFHQLYLFESVKGYVTLEYLVSTDNIDSLASIKQQDSFSITNPVNYKRSYDFDLPEGTVSCKFSMQLLVRGGTADSVSVNNFTFKHDGQVLLNKRVSAEKEELNTSTRFTLPTQTYDF